MAGWKEFAHEIRKRDSHYSGATGQHVAVYALDNNRVYIIDENGGLVDFQVNDGYLNNVQISGNCRIIGQQIFTDTVIDGYDLIFNLDASEVTGNMAGADVSASDWRMDVYSISGVSNGFNQLRIFDNADGKTYISVRKDGAVIIGDNAETKDDDGVNTVQLYGNMVIHGEASSPRGSGLWNEAFGKNSLASNTVGSENCAFGFDTLNLNEDGNFNVAIGSGVSKNNTSGSDNTAIGAYSLFYNTIGNFNVANGRVALHNNLSGDNNVAIGTYALHLNQTGSNNVAIGYGAGYNETESDKLYITNSIGTSADALIYGDFADEELLINGSLTVTGNISEASIQSISFVNAGSTTATTRHLFNKNTSGISSYTIDFPANPSNGQNFTFATRGAITTLTWGGGTANTTPSSASANDRFTWVYNADDSIWMRTV